MRRQPRPVHRKAKTLWLGAFVLWSAVAAQAPSSASAQVGTLPRTPAAAPSAPLADGFPKGTLELRPTMGMVASIAGMTVPSAAQLLTGFELGYSLGGTDQLLFGLWGSTDDGFIGANAHVDLKRRLYGLSSVVLPTLLGGVGFQWGLPRTGKDRRTVTGLELRLGFGLDFQATPRVIPGIQVLLNVGPRFLPSVSVLAATQVMVGVAFVL